MVWGARTKRTAKTVGDRAGRNAGERRAGSQSPMRELTHRLHGEDCMTGSVPDWQTRALPEPGCVACRGAAGRQGFLPNRQERTRPRPHRDTVMAWPAPSCLPGYVRLCHDGPGPVPRRRNAAAKNPPGRLQNLPRSRGRDRKSAASPPDPRHGGYGPRMSSHGQPGDGPTKLPHGNPIPIPVVVLELCECEEGNAQTDNGCCKPDHGGHGKKHTCFAFFHFALNAFKASFVGCLVRVHTFLQDG